MEGWIYIFSNPSIKGQVKIGRTLEEPEKRRLELSSATAIPRPFKSEYHAHVSNCIKAESFLHKEFDTKRVNKKREFFTATVSEIIAAIHFELENKNPKFQLLREEIFYKEPHEIYEEKLKKIEEYTQKNEELRRIQEQKVWENNNRIFNESKDSFVSRWKSLKKTREELELLLEEILSPDTVWKKLKQLPNKNRNGNYRIGFYTEARIVDQFIFLRKKLSHGESYVLDWNGSTVFRTGVLTADNRFIFGIKAVVSGSVLSEKYSEFFQGYFSVEYKKDDGTRINRRAGLYMFEELHGYGRILLKIESGKYVQKKEGLFSFGSCYFLKK